MELYIVVFEDIVYEFFFGCFFVIIVFEVGVGIVVNFVNGFVGFIW